jgi:hypothetical protein
MEDAERPFTLEVKEMQGDMTVWGTYVPEWQYEQMRLRAEGAEWNFKQACETLEAIANADYRGNRSGESVTAHLFLVSYGLRS